MAWDDQSPIHRIRNYLMDHGWWNDSQETEWKEKSKTMVLLL
jgi:TPP-dependent pyruvate/acetoin dehydrogenase alpha subunit